MVEPASFARAAEHLGLSPSALSQTIRLLEARLGTRLLNRTTRSVAPTATGAQLYGRIAPLIRDIDEAVAALRAFIDCLLDRDPPKGRRTPAV